jgi:DNA-binding LacI/PurR family transcriptional regulator
LSAIPGAEEDRRVTSYDVARQAGVAQSTVSRCLAGDASISEATRARVRAAAEKLGYTPNALARGLIRQRSDLIGVAIARYTLRSNPDVLHAIGEMLAASGKRVMLLTVSEDRPASSELDAILEYPLDGLIACVLLRDEDLAAIRRRRLPVVFYNRDPAPEDIDCVTADHAQAAARLAAILHRAGHRRFLCVGGPADAFVSAQRTSGFLAGLRSRGADAPVLPTDFTYNQGRTAFLRHVEENGSPDAVFCANDQIAMGVIDASRFDLGLRVPEQLSVIGFDDVPEVARPAYALTTFFQDSSNMAREAVRLLLQRLQTPLAAPARSVFPAVLVRRGSARLETE